MIQIVLVALAFVFAFSNNGLCREFHVSAVTGSNQNTGDAQYPLKTIQAAAERVLPGDKVIVHAGVYRERVNPIQGGTEKQPIIFQAAEGEKVEIKGSEVIKKWKHVNRLIHIRTQSMVIGWNGEVGVIREMYIWKASH